MSFQVVPVEEQQLWDVTNLASDAISQNGLPEYIATTWPRMNTPEGRKDALTRFTAVKHAVPDPRDFLTVIEGSMDKPIACAISTHHAESPKSLPGLKGDWWHTAEEREYADFLADVRNKLVLRAYALFQGPVTEINIFTTKTDRQRLGVGSLLLDYIWKREESRNAGLVLLSTPDSVGFYAKHGFTVIEDSIFTLPEKWQNKPATHLVSMVRMR